MKILISIILILLSLPFFYLGYENINQEKEIDAKYSGDSFKVSGKYLNYYFLVANFEFIYDGNSEFIIVRQKDSANQITLTTFGSRGSDVIKIFDGWGQLETQDGTEFIPKSNCKYFEISLYRDSEFKNFDNNTRSYNFCLENIDDTNLTDLY